MDPITINGNKIDLSDRDVQELREEISTSQYVIIQVVGNMDHTRYKKLEARYVLPDLIFRCLRKRYMKRFQSSQSCVPAHYIELLPGNGIADLDH